VHAHAERDTSSQMLYDHRGVKAPPMVKMPLVIVASKYIPR